VLAALLAAIILLLVGIWLGGHPGSLPSPLRGRLLESNRRNVTQQALNILATRFYRPVDRSSLVDQGLSAMVAGLDDPYSHYLDPGAYRERNAPSTREIGGIGITTTPEATGLRVVGVVDGSPAAGAGLIPGDLIIKVGSTSLADRPEQAGPDLIRGPPGTRVELTFLRGDKQHVVSIERANIVVPVASWKMLAYQKLRIGYLRLTGFPEDAGDKLRAEVRAALDEHAQALILDLRGNGGGLIGEAVNVTSAFLAHGKVLSAVERGRPRRTYMAEGDAIAPRIPLVVLVDHGTASSAEIVTAALQDDGRAKVVGTRTYGKGTFQQTLPLRNGGALDITIGRFYTPDGRNLGSGGQGDGITPNVDAENNPRTADDEALAAAERTVAAQVR
jgi:carboxyl-terminal processing protease